MKTPPGMGGVERNGPATSAGPTLLAEARAEIVQLAGGAEQHVAASDELRVFLDEDLTRRAEIELLRVVAEVLAVDAGPDQAAVGIDVDLGDAELGGGKVLVGVDTDRAGDLAAGGVDAGDLVLRDGGRAVHDEWEARDESLDLGEHVEVKGLLALKLEGAVRGADGAGEGVA